MMRQMAIVVVCLCMLAQVYGCVVVVAGAAGGIGAAAWLSGKLSQEINAPFDQTLSAVKSALKGLGLNVSKETIKENIAQVMSNYNDGRTIWIDIHKSSAAASRVEIRVGASGDKNAARKILNKILSYI